jgi:hypothetical protein
MNRARENRLLLIIGGLVVVLAAFLFVFRSTTSTSAGPDVAPAPTPTITDAVKAEAVGILNGAVQQRADGQIAAALELADQALNKWPQYDAAQRFLLTVIPQATAAAQGTQARATAEAQSAVTSGQAATISRGVYSTKAGLSLQRYADALGSFYQKNREARERPALVQDSAWRVQTSTALGTMDDAATTLTKLVPVPAGMQVSADLFTQIAGETAQFDQEYARGIVDTQGGALPFASARTDRVLELLRQANFEIRRTAPAGS